MQMDYHYLSQTYVQARQGTLENSQYCVVGGFEMKNCMTFPDNRRWIVNPTQRYGSTKTLGGTLRPTLSSTTRRSGLHVGSWVQFSQEEFWDSAANGDGHAIRDTSAILFGELFGFS
jgi:hypothetical protein